MWRLRSLLFDLLFYTLTPLYLTIGLPFVWIWKRPAALMIFKGWGKGTHFLLKWIVGLDYSYKKRDFPKECIIACRHQSAWETIIISDLFGAVFVVLKKELTYLPIYRTYVMAAESIIVDRKNVMSSIRSLITQAKNGNKRPLFIFPEGTRTSPDAPVKCQHGIAALYRELHVPVYPVILNSGHFWRRRSFFKKPGIIHMRCLDPIPPGLSRQEFITTLENSLSTPL